MATIDIERPHQLTHDEALQRAQTMVAELAGREGLRADWSGARCQLKGTALKGSVHVEPERFVVAIDLGLPMRPFAGFVRNLVNEGLDRTLAAPAAVLQGP